MTDGAEAERWALALFERRCLLKSEDARERALAGESALVRSRVLALEASVARAANVLPTRIPGGGNIDDSLPPPARVGAFRLVERIGRGGMGDVWSASRDDGLYDQRVAVKFIQRHAAARGGPAFEEERRILALLEHPNIARLIDGGVTGDGLPWLAMEYVDGRPIDAACAELSAKARIEIFAQAAEAVRYAHGRLIAHADLKPSNILVSPDGRVKLLDFGIAQLIGGPGSMVAGRMPFTRDFASPQRIAGQTPSVADDVFALGKTLSCVIEGCADDELVAIAARAQSPAQEQRYSSAADLIADLDRWRDALPVSACAPSWRYRSRKFVARHRFGVLATAVALGLLSATSLTATLSYFRAERARLRAEQRFNEVRDLSHFMLFDLYDTLARQPGTVAKRAEIALRGARYLDRLRVSGEASADLQLQTARSYRRLAAIEGLPSVSNLGKPDSARAALDQAERMLTAVVAADPTNAAAVNELAWVATDRWLLHSDNSASSATTAKARRLFDAALALAPHNASAKLGRLTTEANRAYDLIWSADSAPAALPILRSAIGALRSTPFPSELVAQARALEITLLNRTGDALYYAGDVPGSLAPFREADALVDRAIITDGAVPRWLIMKGEDAFNISGSLGDSGHPDAALSVAQHGEQSLKQLLAFGTDAAAEKKLLVLYGQEAALFAQLGRATDGLAVSRESVALREARLRRSPDDYQRTRDLAIGLAPHAALLATVGQRPEACSSAKRTVALWATIRAAGRLGNLDARKNYPQAVALQARLCT